MSNSLSAMIELCPCRYTRGLTIILNGIRKHDWNMDAIFWTISKKYGFAFPRPDQFEINLKFSTLLHKHGVISKAMSDNHVDFETLVEEGINIFSAIVQVYGPYLEIVNDYFVALAIHIQETHSTGLSDARKAELMEFGMEKIQMNL